MSGRLRLRLRETLWSERTKAEGIHGIWNLESKLESQGLLTGHVRPSSSRTAQVQLLMSKCVLTCQTRLWLQKVLIITARLLLANEAQHLGRRINAPPKEQVQIPDARNQALGRELFLLWR
jgi:hypothetical protein